ncbi:MAG TPA: GNAT family N-acetyltransferase [Gaiellales bacterium]
MTVVAAASLAPADLVALFNEGFSDYLIALRLDEAALADHVRANDIDLRISPIVVTDRPVAFVLVGRRGTDAWIGGMATVPQARRRGLGEQAMRSALTTAAAVGCSAVWLEVIDRNRAAVGLYGRLGFERVRDLAVWSLAATGAAPPAAKAIDARRAQAWIAEHRRDPEPWQRADPALEHLRAGGAPLEGLALERSGAIAGALVHRPTGRATSVLQVAAIDEPAAADLLLAAAGGQALQLTNVPEDAPVSRVLAQLGAEAVARQHEMLLRLG